MATGSELESRNGEMNSMGTSIPKASLDTPGQEVGITPRAGRVSEYIDPERQDVYSIIRRAMLLIEEGDSTKGTGPYRAIVIEVMDISHEEKQEETSDPTFAIRARIPELHSGYPIPIDANDLQAIRIYPTFIPRDSLAASSRPNVGDIVMVDYGNREHLEDGVYLSLVTKKGVKAVKGPPSINRGACGGELKNLFTDVSNTIGRVSDNPISLEESSKMDYGQTIIVNDPQFGKMEMVRWPNKVGGHLMTKELAIKLQALSSLVPKEEGLVLRVNSAYRTYEDQNRLYQIKLNNPNYPYPVSAPNKRGKHGIGQAVDLSVLGFNSKEDSHQWLAENAPKVGLETITGDPVHWQIPG